MSEEPKGTNASNEAAAPAKTPRIAMPDTYIIVAVIALVIAALTWVIPRGSYDYHEVDVNGRMRSIAIDGTFRFLRESEANPTGPLAFFASLYTGCVEAADIIFVIFVCAGTFGILVKTGAFHAGIGTVLRRMGAKRTRCHRTRCHVHHCTIVIVETSSNRASRAVQRIQNHRVLGGAQG